MEQIATSCNMRTKSSFILLLLRNSRSNQNMRLNPIIALLLVLPFFSVAQNSKDFSYTIAWSQDRTTMDIPVGKLGFEGALWNDEIPEFFTSERLRSYHNSAEIVDLRVFSSPVGQNLLTPRQKQLAGDDFNVQVGVRQGREESFLLVHANTLRKTSNGGFERLDGFSFSSELRSVGKSRALTWADNSVLAEGEWYRIGLAQDGVYKIDRAFLNSLGVDVDAINPQNINVYGNGGELLPFDNSVFRHDDPQKNAIIVEGEQDGSFDQNDYILFYGKGSLTWTYNPENEAFEHSKHFYSDSAYYFLRVDDPEPRRMQEMPFPGGSVTSETSRFLDHQFIENDIVNLAKSGRQFFGEKFDIAPLSIQYSFPFTNMLSEEARVDASVAARSMGVSSDFDLMSYGENLNLSPTWTSDGTTANVANIATGSMTIVPSAGNAFSAQLTFTKAVPDAVGWLDYIRVNAWRNLSMNGAQMHFRDPSFLGDAGVTRFEISNAGQVREVWDITDPVNVRKMQVDTVNGDPSILEMLAESNELHEYIAFSDFNYLTPKPNGRVENQDLHAMNDVDMVILSSPLFLNAAEDLAQIHSEEGLEIKVVTPRQVYNEFSSGNPDVTAIKMMMKMLYDRADGNSELKPKYLQIVGDGTFMNKLSSENSSYVLTYQSGNSISPTASYVSDDYYAFLDDTTSEALGDNMDIGVGRIPCEDLEQANAYVNKVRRYLSENTSADGGAYCLGDAAASPYGAWRNVICFVSDDKDGNAGPTETVHMFNSDELAQTIYDNHNDYDVVKLYMDAFQQVSTPGGERYPDGAEAINQRVQNGALILNYIGHGGERGFAHERILNIPTIQSWTNINRLPVFMTATCELARFDNPEFRSAGELIVMNPNGGAIAMLTTTRIVFSGSNQQLNRAFFDIALDDAQYPDLTLGFIAMTTKNDPQVSASSNKRNFTLLGDVALKMSYPKEEVYTTAINGVDITQEVDTLRSLQQVTVEGYVGSLGGEILSEFNGFVYPTVFDKKSEVTTLNNDGASTDYQFEVFKNIIYKGKASVINGEFSFSFVVPRDIAYNFGTGRISYYAVAGNKDAHGHTEEFVIGGALEGAELNTVGPDIQLYLNDSSFVFGGLTNEDPFVFAKLFDENGINTVGNGIGHDIKATLDGNTGNPIILNDFYESDLNTYQSGEVRYQLNELSEGTHNLALKVWDVHNNSAESYTEFVVAKAADLALDHVLNYPNPFTTRTEFFFEHNQACEFLDVEIQVFTVSGKLVKTIENIVQTDGFRSDPIVWDGRDDFGDNIGKGVYVYRVRVTTPEGASAEHFERLVILR